jgi:hypothetical protein
VPYLPCPDDRYPEAHCGADRLEIRLALLLRYLVGRTTHSFLTDVPLHADANVSVDPINRSQSNLNMEHQLSGNGDGASQMTLRSRSSTPEPSLPVTTSTRIPIFLHNPPRPQTSSASFKRRYRKCLQLFRSPGICRFQAPHSATPPQPLKGRRGSERPIRQSSFPSQLQPHAKHRAPRIREDGGASEIRAVEIVGRQAFLGGAIEYIEHVEEQLDTSHAAR